MHGHEYTKLVLGDPDTDLSRVVDRLPEGFRLRDYMREIEHSIIRKALKRMGNNKTHSAKLLGLNRTTLMMKIRKMESHNGHAYSI